MSKPTKSASKKAPAKKAKAVKTTGNKELDKMLATLSTAKKSGVKSVVVYTTSKASHKANTGANGFGVSDLKPKLLEAYKHLFCKYDVSTKPVDISEMAIDWIVKF